MTIKTKNESYFFKKLDEHFDYWYKHKKIPEWILQNYSFNYKSSYPVIVAKPNFKILYKKPIAVVAAFSPEIIDLWTGQTPTIVINYIKNTYGVDANKEMHPFP